MRPPSGTGACLIHHQRVTAADIAGGKDIIGVLVRFAVRGGAMPIHAKLFFMTTQEKLEALFDKVRALPEARQIALLEFLVEEIAEEPYVLSEEELAVLRPAVERAKRGEFVPDDEVAELLDKPWR
jgi:phosphoribosylaminoimidazole (AIR) synthetase